MNQTLKKLSENHYIIYKNVVPKEVGIYVYDDDYEKPLVYKTDEVFFEIGKEAFQITHSFGKELEGVDNRPLSEVEELLLGYDLEKLADEYITIKPKYREYEHNICVSAYKAGFKAVMELKKDKLFTIEEMKNAMNYIVNSTYINKGDSVFDLFIEINRKKFINEYIQSLQPTEWKIKINEQNKLELV